jgi:hypothetical protein
VRSFVLSLLGSLALVAGCGSTARPPDAHRALLSTIASCPKSVAQLGRNLRVVWVKDIGTAGIWSPPVSGCSHTAAVSGDAGGARLYFSTDPAQRCFHLVLHTGRQRTEGAASIAIFLVQDVRACTESLE